MQTVFLLVAASAPIALTCLGLYDGAMKVVQWYRGKYKRVYYSHPSW